MSAQGGRGSCPSCGAQGTPGNRFCRVCGACLPIGEDAERPRVLINHRGADDAEARSLYETLAGQLGRDNVFADVEPAGASWLAAIEVKADRVRGVFIAMIGPSWVAVMRELRRASATDTVLLEIALALAKRPAVTVVPVLVGGASMPEGSQLPSSVRPLAEHRAFDLRPGSWNHDLQSLMSQLDGFGAAVVLETSGSSAVPADERVSPPRALPHTLGELCIPEWRQEQHQQQQQFNSQQLLDRQRRREQAQPSRLAVLRERLRARRRLAPPPEPAADDVDFALAALAPSSALAKDAAAAAAAGKSEYVDGVDCTVFAPPVATAGSTLLVQVFLHTPGQAADAAALAAEFDPGSARRGFRGLELPLPHGALVDIELRVSPGTVQAPAIQRLVWRGRAEAVQFEVHTPEAERAEPHLISLTGSVIVLRDGVPIGRVGFRIAVERDATPLPPVPHTDRQRRFRQVFASYASPDRTEVLRRVQVLRAAGIECFQDVLDLEPGERWERELYREIDRADLFLLFWSRAAKHSDWVRREADYALKRQNGDPDAEPEIHPVVIEGPPVELPWEELLHLHFFDPLTYMLERPAE
jgi:hypothetical protein